MEVQVMAAVALPLFSLCVVKIGMKGHVLVLASLIASCSFVTFFLLAPAPSFLVEIAMVGVTLFYALYSAVIWSSMALVVPQEATSIALSIATTMQNVLMTLLPMVFGYINQDQTVKSYNTSLVVFVVIGVLCLLVTIYTTVYDMRNGKVLYDSENS